MQKYLIIAISAFLLLLGGVSIVSAAGCTPFLVASGGTGGCSFTGIIAGRGTGTLYANSTSTVTNGSGVSFTGTPGYLVNGTNLTITCITGDGSTFGCLTGANFTNFNNKISSSSLSGATIISYNSSTGVITTTPGTFGGATVYTFPQDLIITGNSTTTNATTTASFATTASSTNEFTSGFSLATTSKANKFQLEQGSETTSFQVSHNGSTTPSLIINGTNGNGNVGIATSSPGYGLSIGTSTAIITTEWNVSTRTTMLIDWRQGNQQSIIVGSAGTSINMATTTVYPGATLRIPLCNPVSSTGGTVTFDSQILWAGGTAPTRTTTANKCDIYSFIGTRATTTAGTIILGAQTANF